MLLTGCSGPTKPGAVRTADPTVVTSGTPTVAASAASVQPPGRDDAGPPTAPTPPLAQAASTAAAFAAAWVRRDLPADRWWVGVAPLCEPGFANMLRTVDPSNLPASRITGSPVAAKAPPGGSVVYTVATDGGGLTVSLAALNGTWLVVGNDFQRGGR